jgi:hypothetical protein
VSGRRPEIVTTSSALSGVDPARRYGLAVGGRAMIFGGLGHDEAEEVAAALAALGPDRPPAGVLIEVALPIILSDGAGPHLVDVDGRLTLAVADHPTIPGARVAIGSPNPRQRIGVVRRLEPAPLWEWLAVREVPEAARIVTLDEVDRLVDERDATRWGT